MRPGPVITTFEIEPAPGVKVRQFANLANDLALAMRAPSIRVVAPIPGKGAVGIEIPNEVRETVFLKEIIAHEAFKKAKTSLTMALVLGPRFGGALASNHSATNDVLTVAPRMYCVAMSERKDEPFRPPKKASIPVRASDGQALWLPHQIA